MQLLLKQAIKMILFLYVQGTYKYFVVCRPDEPKKGQHRSTIPA